MFKKIFRRAVSILFIASIMLFPTITHAEIYTGEGAYVMSEGENLGVSKERAKADAMRNASEKAGVYVKNYTRTKNLTLEEDIIETMTSNILKLVEAPNFLPYEPVDNLEGILIRVIVKVEIDDSDINRWLNKNEQEKSTLVSQMDALRRANEEQERQIAELKRRLADNPQDKEEITKKFADEDKIFLSNQKVEEAGRLYDRGDHNGALSLLEEALKLNPDNSLAYYGRGTAYDGLNQYQQAIEDFNKAIQLNPNHADAYNNRGIAYMDGLKQYGMAISDFDRAIQLNPNFAKAYYNRGTAYYKQKQYERAIADFNKSIELNPNDPDTYNNRGNVYMEGLQQYGMAISDYDKAIQLNANYDKAYYNRGTAYYRQNQYERAIADYDKAIQLNPNYANAYYNRGNAYCMMKNFNQAVENYTRFIQFNPNYAEVYYWRSVCYKALGEFAKLQADFAKAKELGYNG